MPEDKNQNSESLKQYRYAFENIIFEGGQNKLISYCGAIRVLEETGVWNQIKRLGGSGQGAAMAALLAVGFNSKQLESFLSTDLENVVHDRKLGKCCLGCSSVSSGVHPGKAILKWLGGKMKQATGKTNATFEEVYDKYKRELCVVTTNLSHNRAEYCHVKTTPDMPIIEAVRRSMAAPVLHETVESKKTGKDGDKEFFAEGGLLCNYPIHCFDGWWLSLQPEDSFLKKISKVEDLSISLEDSNRFQPFNTKTIGIITIDKSDGSHLPISLSNKLEEYVATQKPESKLNQNESKLVSAATKYNVEYNRLVAIATNIDRNLAEMKKGPTDSLNKNELTTIVNNSEISADDFKQIFGPSKKQTTDEIFKAVAPKSKKEIKVKDLQTYLERRRVQLQERCTQETFRPIKNVSEYLEAVNSTLHSGNLQQMLASKPRDVERTVPINLGYIKPWHPSNKMSTADKNYALEQGVIAMRYFLEQYIRKAPQLKEDADRRSFCRDDFKQYIDDDLSEIIDERDYMESYLERVL